MKRLWIVALLTIAPQIALAGQGQALGDAWRLCVGREFGKAWAAQLGPKADPDDNRAIESAFLACQTEQDAVYAALALSGREYADMALAGAKLRMKQRILTGH